MKDHLNLPNNNSKVQKISPRIYYQLRKKFINVKIKCSSKREIRIVQKNIDKIKRNS